MESEFGLFQAFSCIGQEAYISIAATSEALDRVFSTSGNIVSASRNRMDPEIADLLKFLAKNMDLADTLLVRA